MAQPAGSVLDRLRRSVIEAAKQCGRNRLMKIADPKLWTDWIASGCLGSSDSEPPADRRLLAHPGGKQLIEIDLTQVKPTQIAIGPEGGLSDTEVAAAIAAGWQSVALGPRILRVETAAIALSVAIALK